MTKIRYIALVLTATALIGGCSGSPAKATPPSQIPSLPGTSLQVEAQGCPQIHGPLGY